MTDPETKTFHAWLNNAYGMELSAVRMYAMHAKDAQDFPELREGLERHREISQKHAEMMAAVIRSHGGEPSGFKAGVGDLIGLLLGFSGDITIDKVIMNNLTDFAAEHFEIAAYETLIAGAEKLGYKDTAARCREILEEEREMASWLERQVDPTAREFLRRAGKRELGR